MPSLLIFVRDEKWENELKLHEWVSKSKNAKCVQGNFVTKGTLITGTRLIRDCVYCVRH